MSGATPAAGPAAGAGPRLEISMAVASGELVVGAVGDHDRLEYTVIGHPVNLAAKLEKHTKVENARALVTADAVALARFQGYLPKVALDLLEERNVAGAGRRLDLFRIVSDASCIGAPPNE